MSSITRLQTFPQKPRVFILTDISNEPDDAESLCRYLLYSNQFDTEGLVACTSTWMKKRVCPQDIHRIIDAYANAVDNLNAHTHPDFPYPSADHLRSLVKPGAASYGMSAVGEDIPLSEGGQLLLERLEAPNDEPLWILCWGGTNVLASVLLKIQLTHMASSAASIRSKIRVYAISDQDDTGAWIRTRFPDVFYISSLHGWNQYGLATWTGISGDKYYGFDQGGPDFSQWTKEWVKENIQIGPLGSAYPSYMFIPEGDTPTFLYLIQNGLGVREQPSYGSWGGRYVLSDISEDGIKSKHHGSAVDHVVGLDGRKHVSVQATIWRWRDAFQNDFAARMQWTLSKHFAAANHHPVVSVNGSVGAAPIYIEAEAGTTITLDASESYDVDSNDKLTFTWRHYRDPTATQWWMDFEVAELNIEKLDNEGKKVKVHIMPPEKCAVDFLTGKAMAKGQVLHVVLEVKDDGKFPLTSYRRVIIQTTNKDLRGGSEGDEIEAVGDKMISFA